MSVRSDSEDDTIHTAGVCHGQWIVVRDTLQEKPGMNEYESYYMNICHICSFLTMSDKSVTREKPT